MTALYIITYLFIGLAIYALMIYLEYTDLVDLGIMENEDENNILMILVCSILFWPMCTVILVFGYIPYTITMKLKAKKDTKR